MTTTSPEISPGKAQLTAEEVGLRILKLIDKLESIEELSLERIREVTDFDMEYHEGRRSFFSWGELTQGWRYTIDWIEKGTSRNHPELIMRFVNTDNAHADMTPVCGMDFDHSVARLNAMGFKGRASYGEHGRLQYWHFKRPNIDLHVQITIVGEADLPRDKILHDCVTSVLIW